MLHEILLKVEGVKEVIICSCLLRLNGYAFVVANPDQRTEEFKKHLLEHLVKESEGIGKLEDVIFVDKIPRT